MARRFSPLLALCLALLVSSAARADVTPEPPKPAAKSSEGGKSGRPLMSRPVVVGLLAALFLIVAGAAGANDKKKKAA